MTVSNIHSSDVPHPNDNLQTWREGYRRYLISKGTPADVAADIAAKVHYRSDLYPAESLGADLNWTEDKVGRERTRNEPTNTANTVLCSPRSHFHRLLTAATEIAEEPPTGKNIVILHSTMCQLGLPRSEFDGTEFERQCGNRTLRITAGALGDGDRMQQQLVPYGAFPRLIIAWVNAEAKRLNSTEVGLGPSGRAFLQVLGKGTSGGQKGAYRMMQRQMLALVASRLTLGFNGGEKALSDDSSLFAQIATWQSREHQRLKWPRTITLSQLYFKELSEHGVPLDWRALKALSGSALAMDVYTMLAERLHRVSGRSHVYWSNFYEQFGQEYQGKRPLEDFKRAFRLALRDALIVYPQARVKKVSGGVILLPSPPPVPYK